MCRYRTTQPPPPKAGQPQRAGHGRDEMTYNTTQEQARRRRVIERKAAIEAAKCKAQKPVRGPGGRFVKRAA